ncbi:hypothetical protein [Novosphingobium sp.]|nr:hypothetical protein [Novosphingobium sp.]
MSVHIETEDGCAGGLDRRLGELQCAAVLDDQAGDFSDSADNSQER